MADSQYAYFSCLEVLYRVKIPTSCEQQFKIEHVFSHLPHYPALFSHRHTVYAVGGSEGHRFVYSRRMCIFDPHQLCLEKKPDFKSMVEPRVIRGAEDRIYFLSVDSYLYNPILDRKQLCFQSFDPIKDCFETLPPPPLAADHPLGPILIFGHFFLRGYIYLLINNPPSVEYLKNVFTFNIKSSKWEERMSLLERFENKGIPPPFGHNGDIGLSDEFSDKTRILVAFLGIDLIAYCLKIHAKGDLEPISYRVMDESCYAGGRPDFKSDRTQVADIGGGKFCVVIGFHTVDLLMYVFQIDFELEHHIQISASGVGASSRILYSKIFQLGNGIGCFCIAPAPPTIEDQDRVGNTSERKKSGDKRPRACLSV